MSGFLGFLIVLLLFVLRFGIPILVLVAASYLINRFYVAWDREDQPVFDA